MKHATITPQSSDAKSNPREASVRILAKPMARARGQRRHDLRIGRQPNYVDGDRTALNRNLVALRPLAEIQRENIALRDARGCVRKMKQNAAVVMAGVITFGHEVQAMFSCLSANQQDAAYLELVSQIAERLGTRVESLDVHADESADHAHFMLRGYTDDGQPVSQVATYAVAAALQDITAEVMQRYCPDIERGHKKWSRIEKGAAYSQTLHRSVKQLHDDLPCEIIAREAQLDALTTEASALRASLEKTRGHLAKAEALRDQSVKQLKRVQTYKKRQATKEAQLDADTAAARVEVAAMRAALTVQKDQLADRKQALDTRGALYEKRDEAIIDDRLQMEGVAAMWHLDAERKRAAIAAQHEQIRRAKSELVTREQEFQSGMDAFAQVTDALHADSLKRGADGKLVMRRPDVVKKAPRWVLNMIAPIVSNVLGLRANLAARLAAVNDQMEKLRAFLDRDDLTVAALSEAEALKEDYDDSDFDGPG